MKLQKQIELEIDNVSLSGELVIPEDALGLVLFSHGSGSSRLSPRNNHVARLLNDQGLATFLFDLLTEEEDSVYETRFDIPLLSNRLVSVTNSISGSPDVKDLPIGYFGASTGAASALNAAANLPGIVKAVVSRGGRPDLAMPQLSQVKAAVLLIVGSLDTPVISMNQEAYDELTGVKRLEIVNGATHLFEEPGKLDEVAFLSIEWFKEFLTL